MNVIIVRLRELGLFNRRRAIRRDPEVTQAMDVATQRLEFNGRLQRELSDTQQLMGRRRHDERSAVH